MFAGDPPSAAASCGDYVHILPPGQTAPDADPAWQAGVKLVEYQVTGDGEEKDAHLFCPVQLTLREPGGRVVKRDVTYIVSTAPNLTVSRKLF